MNQGLTALGKAILRQWRESSPKMVAELEQQKRLNQAVLEAQTRTSDLFYELVSVEKMEYHMAWEMATREWAFTPEEARQTPMPASPETSPNSRSGTSKSPPSSRNRPRRRGTSG